MSRRRTHPIFVAYAQEVGCGHQHSTIDRAINCARNTLSSRKFIFLDKVFIHKVRYSVPKDIVRQEFVQIVTRQ